MPGSSSSPPPGTDPGQGDGQGQGGPPLDKRVADLEAGQSTISEKIDKILGVLDGGSGKPKEDPPAGPGGGRSVAEEIRAQFEERDRKAAEDARRGEDKSWRESVDKALKGLAERTPEPPPRRVEKVMGWR
jgi:hypothetical protein